MAYRCKRGGECIGCGECENKDDSVCCPVCGEECSTLYLTFSYTVLGCESCVCCEDSRDVAPFLREYRNRKE